MRWRPAHWIRRPIRTICVREDYNGWRWRRREGHRSLSSNRPDQSSWIGIKNRREKKNEFKWKKKIPYRHTHTHLMEKVYDVTQQNTKKWYAGEMWIRTGGVKAFLSALNTWPPKKGLPISSHFDGRRVTPLPASVPTFCVGVCLEEQNLHHCNQTSSQEY